MLDKIWSMSTTIIRAFIGKYEIYFGIGIFSVAVFLGWYLHGIFYNAAEADSLKAELANYKFLSEKYHNASDAYQKLNQTLLDSQQTLMDKAHETTDPVCGNKPIASTRLRLIKGARATLVSR